MSGFADVWQTGTLANWVPDLMDGVAASPPVSRDLRTTDGNVGAARTQAALVKQDHSPTGNAAYLRNPAYRAEVCVQSAIAARSQRQR